ncbi:secreted RxLR effector protein 161-like [Leptopilina heterotoma]|uniref:secreted RxLR effector protein 161-like n=1 Tax=Leptopilina heterotoma TaxID=63436 RepID=UPI001CA7FDB1|nr:secreted RxLR effector protein 161-like [Leptopilina heterotoma]
MEQAKEAPTPIDPSTKISKDMSPKTEDERNDMRQKPYRELIGGLIYLANATRPDIAFAASALSRFCSDPGIEHWIIAKRVLRYLKATSHFGISYIKNQENLQAYTDSDWAGDIDDRKSCSGNVLILSGGPISWKSKKQASVALSTMEAEYLALSEISREVIYVKRLLSDMGFVQRAKSPIKVFCDNQSAIELSKNCVFHKRSKHIDIRFHFTRELVENKEIKISYIRTDMMLADVLTKPLTKCKHYRNVEMLCLN